MDVKVIRMRKIDSASKLKAVATVELSNMDGSITISGVKVFNGTKGLFTGMPAEQGRKDTTKWYDIVTLSDELGYAVKDAVLAEFEHPSEASAPAKPKAPAAERSSRAPVPASRASVSDVDGDDIPF